MKIKPNPIDRHSIIDKLNNLFDEIKDDDTIPMERQTSMLIAIMRCIHIVLAEHELTPVDDTLKPCDPSLLDKPLEEFLRIVDDASVYGLEVIIHNGKPYYRSIVDC